MSPRFPTLLATALFPTLLFAQAPPIDPRAIAATAHGVSAVDGTLVAGGASYRAIFRRGEIEITPALGSQAPRSMPLRLSLRGIRRGGTGSPTLLPAVEPSRTPDGVAYEHSGGAVERYVPRADGLKQSVVFAARPAGSGDLVVRYDVDTDLQCAPRTGAATLAFRTGDLGGIDVGAVLGIDALGATAAGSMHFDGQHLDLVLPAAFVDRAAYPLELDPLLSGVTNTGVSFNDARPDIAYDRDNDVYFVVFEFGASATDVDVVGQRISGAGAPVGNAIWIATGTHRSQAPAVCNCNIIDRFFVCWQDNLAGNWDIKGCSIDAATGVMSAIVDIAATAADEVAPDCGGEEMDVSGIDFGDSLCVWDDRALGLRGADVHVHGNPPFVTGTSTIVGLGDPFRNNPAITKSSGPDRRFVIAYQHDTQFLATIAVDGNMNILSQPYTAFYSQNELVDKPDIDGTSRGYLVVLERNEPGRTQRDIYGSAGRFDAATGTLQTLAVGPIENDQNEDERDPAVAFLGPMHVVGWTNPSPGRTDLQLTNIVPGTVQRSGSEQLVSIVGEAMTFAALGAKRAGGAASDEALLSYRRFVVATGNALLDSRRYRAFGGGPVTALLPGCGTGGTCSVNGPAALGNSQFAVRLTGADPAAQFGLMFADVLAQPTYTCGSCTRIEAMFSFFAVPAGGAAQIALPLSTSTAYLGLRMDAQWVTISPGSSPCAPIPGLVFSNAIRIVLAD